MMQSSFWKVPPSYVFQPSALWVFYCWMRALNVNHKSEFCHVRWDCLPIKSPCSASRQYLILQSKSFHLETFGPNLPIASTINTGSRGGQNTAEWSAAVFISYHLCETAEYFQAWADVHTCGIRCRTWVNPKTLEAFGGDWLRCPQLGHSLGRNLKRWSGPTSCSKQGSELASQGPLKLSLKYLLEKTCWHFLWAMWWFV